MSFSNHNLCLMAVLVVLVGLCTMAYICKQNEAFDLDSIKTDTKDTTWYNRYRHIDSNNKQVCYPSEIFSRHPMADTSKCSSFRVQNPALYRDNIYIATQDNPLQKIKLGDETLEDVLLDKKVKKKIENVFSIQDTMFNEINQYHESIQNADIDKKINAVSPTYPGHPLPPFIAPPSLPIVNPCNTDKTKCTYKEFEYKNPIPRYNKNSVNIANVTKYACS